MPEEPSTIVEVAAIPSLGLLVTVSEAARGTEGYTRTAERVVKAVGQEEETPANAHLQASEAPFAACMLPSTNTPGLLGLQPPLLGVPARLLLESSPLALLHGLP